MKPKCVQSKDVREFVNRIEELRYTHTHIYIYIYKDVFVFCCWPATILPLPTLATRACIYHICNNIQPNLYWSGGGCGVPTDRLINNPDVIAFYQTNIDFKSIVMLQTFGFRTVNIPRFQYFGAILLHHNITQILANLTLSKILVKLQNIYFVIFGARQLFYNRTNNNNDDDNTTKQMYVYIYIYIYTHTYIYIYIYILRVCV